MSSNKKEIAMRENGKSIWKARALLSNEKRGGLEAAGETSFRVCYGQNGAAVPFMWESQPGTPKHPLSSSTHSNDHHNNIDDLPPLTPPPQFHSSSSSFSSTSFRKNRRSRIFSTFFSSVVKRSNSHVIPSPVLSYSSPHSDAHSRSTSSSLSSSESVSFSSSKKKHMFHRRSVSVCSIIPVTKKFPLFYDDDNDEEMDGSPNNNTSTIICFGFKKQGCYSFKGI